MKFQIDLREGAGSLQKQIETQGYIMSDEKLYALEKIRCIGQKNVKEGKWDIEKQKEEVESFIYKLFENIVWIGEEEE